MLIIAEIGQAHEGSLGIAHSYIDALADTGVSAVKFQTHIAEAESSVQEPFRVKFSYEDSCRFEYWKRMEFTLEQWQGLKQHCEDKGMEFISSPFSNAAVDLLEKLGVKRYKIGSGEINNFLMLNKIASTGKNIILSSGMSSYLELDQTISYLKNFDIDISLLQCTTAYPTQPEQWGLNVIGEMKARYNVPVGFSDHSGDIFACLAAVVVGASILEFHVVFDKRMFGPDARASLTISQVQQLVEGVNQIHVAQKHQVNKDAASSNFSSLKTIFEKSLAINSSMEEGSTITEEVLEAKKPKNEGVLAANYRDVLGKKLRKNKQKWDFIKWEDFYEET